MSDALVFSKYIRLRDAEAITGLVTCCTCGILVHWTEADAAHYYPHPVLKFSTTNAHAQCPSCNRSSVVIMHHSVKIRYESFLRSKYGADFKSVLKKPLFKKATSFKHEVYLNKIYRLLEKKNLIDTSGIKSRNINGPELFETSFLNISKLSRAYSKEYGGKRNTSSQLRNLFKGLPSRMSNKTIEQIKHLISDDYNRIINALTKLSNSK